MGHSLPHVVKIEKKKNKKKKNKAKNKQTNKQTNKKHNILLPTDMFKNCWMSGKQWRSRSDAAFCGVWSESTLFAQALPT